MLFPELLVYAEFSPFILRIVLGLVLINLGYLKFSAEKTRWRESFGALHMPTAARLVTLFGVIQIFCSILLFAGLYTQAVALILSVTILYELVIESIAETILIRNFTFYLLLFVIAFSLLFTGPGMYALDLPYESFAFPFLAAP
ncbi:MAG: hypothetical protein G01um101448_412 [Parcubacteria group bacterium Gr01-1014_48]|nr:MAG: hypothetical protein Greene041614_792 [Parcubacteria group bacterium Greene0416_14]TSC73981.1 MAG: hypothetical protein G01um101448_412 [Parcubacteria group bacterium Gr01-1014_48]TSD00452.1 MAG: hypothetical protein Greene101415_842 [Parcubacteria group bacterium Greene1014_15]TSD07874.1 MAG: hypothetical protein Greene07144_642 [Parcubacteria group bacterium Greene0714_4]